MSASNEQVLTAVLRLRDEMTQQLARPKQAVQGMANDFKVLSAAAKKAFGIISASVVLMTRSVMQTADQLDRLSRQTGVSVESLQKLAFVAAESGATLQDVGSGMRFLGRSLNAALQGSQEAINNFGLMGISLDELKAPGMNVEKLFMRVADSMAALNDEQKQNVFRIMGRGAQDLIPLLSEGSAKLQELGESAKNTGAIMSKEAVAALDTFGDQLEAMSTAVKGMWGEFLASNAISINEVLDEFGTAAKEINAFKEMFVLAFKTIKNTILYFASLIKVTFNAIVEFITVAMNKVVGTVTTPLLKIAKFLESNGLLNPFKEMMPTLEGWSKAADQSLSDPFINFHDNVIKAFDAFSAAQSKSVEEAKESAKQHAASTDIIINRLKLANDLQTEAGRKKAGMSSGGDMSSISRQLDSEFNGLLSIIKARQQIDEEKKKSIEQFKYETGIALTTEQVEQLKKAWGEGTEAVSRFYEEVKRNTEADPFAGAQLALYDLTRQTFNFRDAWGDLFRDLQEGFSETFANALDGTEKFSDGFKRVMKDLKRNLIKMFTDFLTNGLMSSAGGGLMGLFGQLGLGGGGAPGTTNTGVPGPGAPGGQAALGGAGVGGVSLSSIGTSLGIGADTMGAIGGAAMGGMMAYGGYKNGNSSQTTAGMAMAGLSIGAMAGPIGAVAGLAIGAIVGAVMGRSARRRAKRARRRAAYLAAILHQQAVDRARVVLKQDIRNKMGGGLATEDAAAEIGQLFSEDLSESEIMKFGSPEQIAARADEVNRQTNVNAPITVNAQVSGSYDVQKLAEDLSYHLQNQMAGAAGGI